MTWRVFWYSKLANHAPFLFPAFPTLLVSLIFINTTRRLPKWYTIAIGSVGETDRFYAERKTSFDWESAIFAVTGWHGGRHRHGLHPRSKSEHPGGSRDGKAGPTGYSDVDCRGVQARRNRQEWARDISVARGKRYRLRRWAA